MTDESTAFEIPQLQMCAIQLADELTEEDKIRKKEVTQMLYSDLKWFHKNRRLINIQILGNPTIGKSTVAMKLTYYIVEKVIGKHWTLNHNLVRDQLEFARKVMDNPELGETCIQIDEYVEMAETGENATVEQAWLNQFSDVHAQQYVHRISCAPKDVIDKNAFLILEVLAVNKELETTRCLVYYKILKNNMETSQLVGYADINVSEILRKPEYKEYRLRKFQKMELITKKGIRDIREMEYSDIILEVITKLEGIAKYGIVKKEIIRNTLEKITRDKKRFLSMLGAENMSLRIKGYLDAVKQTQTLTRAVKAVERGTESEEYKTYKIKEITKTINDLHKILAETKASWEELVRVKAEYDKIEA